MAAGSLYSPVRRSLGGAVEVDLGDDHPGVSDPAYRARRSELASLSIDWQPGDPVPQAEYTDVEHEVWRLVSRDLGPLHQRHACRAFLDAKEELGLPEDHVPQLDEVTERLGPVCGFRYLPVAGLAPLRGFYGAFADSSFFSTQYVRHHSVPLYTPEPDIIHEVIGHANQLAHRPFAELYRLVGDAVRRVTTDEALRFLSRVFWFSFEFGVVWEDGEPRAYGAGILSSSGECANFAEADLRPLDVAAMGTLPYDITRYQPVLFAARSTDEVVDAIGAVMADYDDDTCRRLLQEAS
ncbi:MAG TPA: phenylalanine 4-monooxygenase [Acidimicrobiales bacterium]|nr:phenylalanine 4-monooxygenase [Acidimicrobiales bacterium]